MTRAPPVSKNPIASEAWQLSRSISMQTIRIRYMNIHNISCIETLCMCREFSSIQNTNHTSHYSISFPILFRGILKSQPRKKRIVPMEPTHNPNWSDNIYFVAVVRVLVILGLVFLIRSVTQLVQHLRQRAGNSRDPRSPCTSSFFLQKSLPFMSSDLF